MSKKYRFITIEPALTSHIGKPNYVILNNRSRDTLGNIFFYHKWNQYVCEFSETAVFNQECLENIIDFLKELRQK